MLILVKKKIYIYNDTYLCIIVFINLSLKKQWTFTWFQSLIVYTSTHNKEYCSL